MQAPAGGAAVASPERGALGDLSLLISDPAAAEAGRVSWRLARLFYFIMYPNNYV
jgi:hypothetical protein